MLNRANFFESGAFDYRILRDRRISLAPNLRTGHRYLGLLGENAILAGRRHSSRIGAPAHRGHGSAADSRCFSSCAQAGTTRRLSDDRWTARMNEGGRRIHGPTARTTQTLQPCSGYMTKVANLRLTSRLKSNSLNDALMGWTSNHHTWWSACRAPNADAPANTENRI